VPFLTEPEPHYGIASEVHPGVRRVVARNPSPMTYHGTNTYIVDRAGERIVIDPGPDDAGHVAALLSAIAGRLDRILLTHTHQDHVGAVNALQAATSAPVHAFHTSARPGFTPDVPIEDGEEVAGFTAIHTPGHAADHLCFAADGLLFSGDHVMGWSSTVVRPPRGDMTHYYGSLRRLLERDDAIYLAGHGPALTSPQTYVRELLHHREEREAQILAAVSTEPQTAPVLMDRLYNKTDPMLRAAAECNVNAHLLKLELEGRVRRAGDVWHRG
jgi:glyoxylase-like metal-dependent hydrolase (beta-lactamase superfamily II)